MEHAQTCWHTYHMLHVLQYLLYMAALPWPLLRIHTPLPSLLYRCLSGTAAPASNCSITGSAGATVAHVPQHQTNESSSSSSCAAVAAAAGLEQRQRHW